LKRKSVLGRSVDEEIEFASSHFFELDLNELRGIEVSLLERIVSSPELRLTGEDSLLDFICSLDCGDEIVLLRYLRSEYLSTEGMSMLLDHLNFPDLNLDYMIWSSICRRLRLPVSHGKGSDENSSVLARFVNREVGLGVESGSPGASMFPMKEEKSLDGVISYLTQKHGGNVHEKGIVTITSKSVFDDPMCSPANAADFGSRAEFISTKEPHQWICWDFREMRLRLTHYTIRALVLRSWVVEGSMDGAGWAEIDRRTDSQDFTGDGWPVASFSVSHPGEFRFIRLTQRGINHNHNHTLLLAAVEFFGTLSE
jgi:hypothetical protein